MPLGRDRPLFEGFMVPDPVSCARETLLRVLGGNRTGFCLVEVYGLGQLKRFFDLVQLLDTISTVEEGLHFLSRDICCLLEGDRSFHQPGDILISLDDHRQGDSAFNITLLLQDPLELGHLGSEVRVVLQNTGFEFVKKAFPLGSLFVLDDVGSQLDKADHHEMDLVN